MPAAHLLRRDCQNAHSAHFCTRLEPPGRLRRPNKVELKMFGIYEWNFSSTAELAVGALLVVTILSVVVFV
jgi:hypothetical protein